uniref:ubiquitinyl hydrolase 1 n=1 Tax=Dermatophagoides pteronyssinus TaxID=6956 RepID=A0A6P6Y8D4_DERPT|nr:probable cyclin-dependent serine/threonine-protein kinase DDB_G0292550 [Dermatophagoides pteronyssinus]
MMIDSTMSTFDEAIDNHTENDDDCIVEKLQSSSLSSTKMSVNNTNNTNNHNHNNHHHPTINSNENPGLFKLNQLAENWLELESDPGLFTLLIKDFGCPGVEVEEIYDLQSSFDNMDHVYGFIFLFNVIEERRNRCSQRNSIVTVNATASTSTLSTTTSTTTINSNGLNYQSPSCLLSGNFIDDPKFLNEMFFAHQKVPNSCATHAILSILLNCSQYLDIGPMLKRLKEYTTDMTPEDKGLAISNLAELAKAHNSHATHMYMVNEREQHHHHTTSNAIRISQRNTNSTMEAFHFVSFVPINGRLIELDGLKERPIDHGLIDPLKESWMEKFRRLVRQRIETSAETTVAGDIRYNLMAVIPNKYDCRQRLLNTMEFNRSSLLKTIHQMEYHRSIQMRYEHNYSNIDYQNFNDIVDCSTTSFLPDDPLNSQIKLTANSLIFDDNQQSSIMETCDDNDIDDDDGTSTDTASEASSSYNFSPHNTHQNDDDDDGEKCTKFFICKFDKNNDHNNPAFDSDDDDDYSTATTTTSDDEKNLDEISAEIIEDILKKIIDTTDDSFESESENDDNDHSCKINNRKWRKKKNLKRKFLIKTRKKKRKNIHNNNEEEMKLIESIIKEIGLNSQTLSPTSSPSVETQTTVKQSTKSSTILQDIVHLIETLNHRILRCQHECVEEKHKLERYAIDVNRRTHDYDNLIQTFLSMLSDQGLLDDLLGYHHNDNNDNNNDEWSSNSNPINYESSSISTTDLIPSPFDLDSIRNSEIHSTTTTNFSNHHNDNNNDNTKCFQ